MNTEEKLVKIFAKESGHWYSREGQPCYVQAKKDGSGTRPTTVADARKQSLLPSVTTILQASAKPALTRWLQKNAIEAALTTPKLPDETVDAFAERVLDIDAESISDAAKDKGTWVHGAIELALQGQDYADIAAQFTERFQQDIAVFVKPAVEACLKFGKPIANEKVIVGNGYAGKLDTLCESDTTLTVIDFKTCSKIPKAQYDEHRMQLGCYAAAIEKDATTPPTLKAVEAANIYISTTNPGEVAVIKNTAEEWTDAYQHGFLPLFGYWQWVKGYFPKN